LLVVIADLLARTASARIDLPLGSLTAFVGAPYFLFALRSSVSLALRAGEALALVGPNAAGKSTLVRALGGLLRATGGEVRLLDRPLAAWSRDALARQVALVAPEETGATAISVRDRVALGRYPHRGPFRPFIGADDAAVGRALEQTGIGALAERALGTLSAGERQLAALARGLAQEPRVLLLDEPAAHLDVGHQLALFRVLDEVRARGVAVLAVIHDLARAAAWAERMLLLEAGRVAAEGAPDAVLGSEACARAFHVRIQGHPVPGRSHPLYSFEEDA
jgi:iron complex transport system ATP-binding protein